MSVIRLVLLVYLLNLGKTNYSLLLIYRNSSQSNLDDPFHKMLSISHKYMLIWMLPIQFRDLLESLALKTCNDVSILNFSGDQIELSTLYIFSLHHKCQ